MNLFDFSTVPAKPEPVAQNTTLDKEKAQAFVNRGKELGKSRAEIKTAYDKAKAAGIFELKQPVQPKGINDLPLAEEGMQRLSTLGGQLKERGQKIFEEATRPYDAQYSAEQFAGRAIGTTGQLIGGAFDVAAQAVGFATPDVIKDPVIDALKYVGSGYKSAWDLLSPDTQLAAQDAVRTGGEALEEFKTNHPELAYAAEGGIEIFMTLIGERGIQKTVQTGTELAKRTTPQLIKAGEIAGEITGKGLKKVKELEPLKGAKEAVTRTIPESIVKKDLGFTPKERSKIESITGKTEGAYVLEKGLAGKGKSELAEHFAKQANDNYKGIDTKLSSLKDVPSTSKVTTEALEDILDQLTSSKKFERAYAADIKAVREMLARGEYTLLEKHRIRKSFDKVNTGMFTAQGKARTGLDKDIDLRIRQGVSNELQEGALKHGVDVKSMNAELRAGIEMKEALLRRLSQEERNNFLGLQDIGVGAILSGGDPFTGIGLVAAKKYLEGVAPSAAQKLYNLNKAKDVSRRLTRGSPISTTGKSSKLGLVTKPRADLVDIKVEPKHLKKTSKFKEGDSLGGTVKVINYNGIPVASSALHTIAKGEKDIYQLIKASDFKVINELIDGTKKGGATITTKSGNKLHLSNGASKGGAFKQDGILNKIKEDSVNFKGITSLKEVKNLIK